MTVFHALRRLCRQSAPTLLLLPIVVTAQEADPYLKTYDIIRYDSNLFRLPEDQAVNGLRDRASYTNQVGVGLHLDKSYSLQRAKIDVDVFRDHYTGYSNLDATGHDIDAVYDWSVTPNLTGVLTYEDYKAPADFEFVGFQTRPIYQKRVRRRLDIDLRAGAALHPRLSIFRNESTTDRPTFQTESSTASGGEASLFYDFASGNTLSVFANRVTGDAMADVSQNTTFVDRSFTAHRYGVRFVSLIGGYSDFKLDVGETKREYDTFAMRNFSGLVGAAAFNYRATGKTGLNVTFSRNLFSSETDTYSYFREDILYVSPYWRATTKLTVRPSYTSNRRRFEGFALVPSESLYEDRQTFALTTQWNPRRLLELSLLLSTERRSSNSDLLRYRNKAAVLSATVDLF